MGPGSGGAGGGPGTSSRSGPPRQRPLQGAKGAKELQGSSQNLQIGTTTTIWRPSLPPPPVLAHPPALLCAENPLGLYLVHTRARPRGWSPSSCGPPRVCPRQRPVRWIYPLGLSVDLRRPAECLSHSLSPSLVEVAWTEVPSPARHQPPARSHPAAPRARLPRVFTSPAGAAGGAGVTYPRFWPLSTRSCTGPGLITDENDS